MRDLTRARTIAIAFIGALFATATAEQAQAQNAVITGKVASLFGQAIEGANVYINDLNVSVPTNAQGEYTISIAPSRASGQQMTIRVRALGFSPDARPIKITAGSQTVNFSLKQDINRLDEIVVTGSVEGTERAKVPFSVARLSSEDIPVPALDPLRALAGKVAGVRIAQTSGFPGTTPEIMMRGPKSINGTNRTVGPLLIVDGVILHVGSLEELGGLDIESVEVVKGAAGASLYGSQAANGVIVIKTKRGHNSEGVRFSARTEYGISDVNSLDYGQPVNHHLQLDETGTRFCIGGSGNASPCSRTQDFMQEIMRINNVNADTTRTPLGFQFNAPAAAGSELLNLYQAQIWPNRYYNSFAAVATQNPITINSIDASGKAAGVRFFVSASNQSDGGAVKELKGQQQRRGRVNLDYDVRNDVTLAVSMLYDQATTDLRSGGSSNGGIFGQITRGAPAGMDYSRRDTLGRRLVRGGGSGIRGSGNGAGTLLYDMENLVNGQEAERFVGNMSANYFPTDWFTLEGAFAYDNRQRTNKNWEVKGYRTFIQQTSDNNGQMTVSGRGEAAYNGSITATMRKQITSDLSGKLSVRGLFDNDVLFTSSSSGEVFVVKDVFTLSNTTTNKSVSSSTTTVKNQGFFAGGTADYKGKYILDGTYRYDGSSLFGSGNRWAPFGRVSGVWRVSEESFWNVGFMTDFRLRASRGSAGATPSFTAQYETYSCGTTGCSLGQAGNPNLKPETTTETEVGTDFQLFNRLGVELTNARSTTVDQILNVPTPASLGFSSQWRNAGTLDNNTYELAMSFPVMNRKNLSWSMRGTYDHTVTSISKLNIPAYFTSTGLGNGDGSIFFITANDSSISQRTNWSHAPTDSYKQNRFGNIWGRMFYKSCSQLPNRAVTVGATTTTYDLQSQCGPGKEYQVNNQGYVVWVGAGNSWQDGITKNLWQTYLPKGSSPFNYPLSFGHPIVDRPLRGEPLEGIGRLHVLGNTLPDFRMTFSNNFQYKRLSAYALLDGTFGNDIYNRGEGWGIFDFNSAHFDQASNTVETAKPVGYTWRAGGSEGVGTGGFYDILGPNSYAVESDSYAKLREVSLTYRVGPVASMGDWTIGVVGRNLMTFTNYSGYDPETGVSGGPSGSGLVNQVDAAQFPTLRTYTFTLSTRF